jgi:hypothetical protein
MTQCNEHFLSPFQLKHNFAGPVNIPSKPYSPRCDKSWCDKLMQMWQWEIMIQWWKRLHSHTLSEFKASIPLTTIWKQKQEYHSALKIWYQLISIFLWPLFNPTSSMLRTYKSSFFFNFERNLAFIWKEGCTDICEWTHSLLPLIISPLSILWGTYIYNSRSKNLFSDNEQSVTISWISLARLKNWLHVR